MRVAIASNKDNLIESALDKTVKDILKEN